VVENKPGSNGIIAAKTLLQSPPDGYHFLVIHTSFVQNLVLRPGSYNGQDFIGVSQIADTNPAFAVNTSLGVTDLKSFIDHVSASKETHSYGSYGVASTAHIYGEALKKAAGINMIHV